MTIGTALILGATGAIGSDLARRLAAQGFHVVLNARHSEPLEALAAELGGVAVGADATISAEVDRLFAVATSQPHPLVAVAHCVGSVLLKPAHLTTDDEWDQTLAINLTSGFRVLRASARAMRSGGGSVALVSSAAARLGLANHEAIAAAKGGIESMVRSAAATYAPMGIRINAVAPGLVASGITERIVKNEASLKVSVGMHALGRIGAGSDVASALAWLLSPEQSWVTGQVLGVDGGLATVRSR